MNREPIHAALFAKLQAVAGIVTCTRKLKHWVDVTAAEQPALFLGCKNEVANSPAHGAPIKWTMSFEIHIYVDTSSDPYQSPAAVLNPILDAIEVALAPSVANGLQQLGGLVEHCRINGSIQIFEGDLGSQAVATIPIEIVTAS